MQLSSIQNKTVLVRVGFDVPDFNNISRIDSCLATLDFLLKNNNKLVLISKWGRPENFDKEFSLNRLVSILELRLNKFSKRKHSVVFLNQFNDWKKAESIIKNGLSNKIFLLENLYFDSREFSNNESEREVIAKQYSKFADYFVDECFISSHRHDATNTEIRNFLSTSLGLQYQAELDALGYFKEKPKKPFILLVGGAKLSTKLPLLKKLLPKADKVILAGTICFPFLKSLNKTLKIKADDSDILFATQMLQEFPEKIILAEDFLPNQDQARDIGPKTIKSIKKILSSAGSVFWNGPLGEYEKPEFAKGTLEIASFLATQNQIYKVLGGGDTSAAIPTELLLKFNFVSQGGGATLDYLSRD
jgi:phosphoglycerate kinase